MADLLATVVDLAARIRVPVSDLDATTATLLLECATAVVQEAAGDQRILQVTDDVTTLTGTTDSSLHLPQIPVTAVASVTLDGSAVTAGAVTSATAYKRFGNRLWRGDGWQVNTGAPSEVVVVNTHGYAAGSQNLQFARSAVLALLKGVYDNVSGATQLSIDDYSVAYEAVNVQMEATPYLEKALRKKYGHRGRPVRIG